MTEMTVKILLKLTKMLQRKSIHAQNEIALNLANSPIHFKNEINLISDKQCQFISEVAFKYNSTNDVFSQIELNCF